jgi:hypothetical protein
MASASRTLAVAVALVVSAAVVGIDPAGAGARSGTAPRALLAYARPASIGARNGVVYLARPDGSAPRRVGVGIGPMLSGDGTRIAFVHDSPTAPTLVLGRVAGGPRSRVAMPERSQLVGWVGDRVLISGTDGLFLGDGTSSGWRRLVGPTIASGESPVFAAVSPDGQDIAVLGSSPSAEDLFVVHVADGHVRALTANALVGGAAWGTSGIAYSTGPARHSDIWLVQPDGSGQRQITHVGANIQPVAFDASGTRLLAANPAMNNGRLWAVDVQRGSARPLTPWVGDLFGQGISRDGRTVFAAVGCGGMPGWYGHLETIPFAGGHPRAFAPGACRGSWTS